MRGFFLDRLRHRWGWRVKGFCWVGFFLRFALSAADWVSGPGYRSRELLALEPRKSGFTRLPPATTGVTFTKPLADALAAQNRILEMVLALHLGTLMAIGSPSWFCEGTAKADSKPSPQKNPASVFWVNIAVVRSVTLVAMVVSIGVWLKTMGRHSFTGTSLRSRVCE